MWYIEDKGKIIHEKCEKCRATYMLITGHISNRTNCRYHRWDQNGICIDCHILGESNIYGSFTATRNCYHTRRGMLCIIL